MKTLFFTLSFIAAINFIIAQSAPEIEWQNTIGGDVGDELTAVQPTGAGIEQTSS